MSTQTMAAAGPSGLAAGSTSVANLVSMASSVVIADVAGTSDRQVNEVCLELLNAEAVALFLATTPAPVVPAASVGATVGGRAATDTSAVSKSSTTAPPSSSSTSTTAVTAAQPKPELDLGSIFARLEAIGFQVGLRLTERHANNQQRFNDAMECVKFVCRDLWTLIFKKQADNLKTNHKGTFVLQDASFRWFLRMSPPGRMLPTETIARARLYAALPCGIIRGSLANLGLNATVVVEVQTLPQCSFKINIIK